MGSTLFFANGVVGTAQSPSPTLIVGAQFIEPDDNGFDESNPYNERKMTLTPFLLAGASWRTAGRGTFAFSGSYYGDFAKDLRSFLTSTVWTLHLKSFLFF